MDRAINLHYGMNNLYKGFLILPRLPMLTTHVIYIISGTFMIALTTFVLALEMIGAKSDSE